MTTAHESTFVDHLVNGRFWEDRAGGCHVLALAIHKLTGWPIAGLMRTDEDPDDPPDAQPFQGAYSDVAHVYCEPPYDVTQSRDPRMFDCEGVGDLDDYKADVTMDTGWEVDDTPLSEADVRELVEIGWLRAFTEEHLREAMSFARQLLLDEDVPPGMIAAAVEGPAQPSSRQRAKP